MNRMLWDFVAAIASDGTTGTIDACLDFGHRHSGRRQDRGVPVCPDG